MIEHNETHNDADKAKDTEARANLSFFKSIRGKILGLFLAFAILPSLFAVGFSYRQISETLEDRIKNDLGGTAQLQAARLDEMFEECIKDMRVVAATDTVRSMAPQGIHRTIMGFNELWKRYSRITIYRADGYAIAESTGASEETRKANQNIADREYFRKAVRGEETISSDTVMGKTGEGLIAMIAVPIYGKGVIGVAVADLPLDVIAFSLYESRFGLMGDLYLVNREGYFIMPSQFLELRIDTFGARKALAGKPGASIYYDYRGEEVLGAYTPIPRTGWGLLIEQETRKALAPVRRLRNISILVGLMFAGLATGIAVFISGGMIKKTTRLTRAARELRKGSLTVRADVTGSDELGQLAESFNSMADRIGALVSELEQQVEKQRAANEALQREVAERKQAEESLRESEVRYRTLFDGVPVALYRSTPANQFLDVNTAMIEMFGFPDRESMVALNIVDIYADPEDRVRWKALMEKEELLRDFESRMRRLDGRLFWTRKTSRVVKDDQGRTVYYEGSLEDITERIIAEEALKKHHEQLLTEIQTRKNFERELEKSREQLRRLSEHLQQARENERTRIAREVHDELGQSLSALKIDLTCLGNGIPEDYASLREQTKTMEAQIDDFINTVRTICSRLRPPMLDHFGLPAALQWYLQEFEKRTGIACSAEIDQNISVKNKDLALVVFRIVQEATTNILRHAAARNVTVTLNKKGSGLSLKVEDDGKGILEEEVSNPRSLGLIGIQERVRFRDGRVQFQGIPGRGTTMTIWMPIGRHKRNASEKGFETREEGTP